jgi:hypothetical protein
LWLRAFVQRGINQIMPIVNKEQENVALVDATGCLAEIFPDVRSRPSLRWFKNLQRDGVIPYMKIGHRVFFDASQVRRALDKRCRRTT